MCQELLDNHSTKRWDSTWFGKQRWLFHFKVKGPMTAFFLFSLEIIFQIRRNTSVKPKAQSENTFFQSFSFKTLPWAALNDDCSPVGQCGQLFEMSLASSEVLHTHRAGCRLWQIALRFAVGWPLWICQAVTLGIRNAAGSGAGVTAGGLKKANLMWAAAGKVVSKLTVFPCFSSPGQICGILLSYFVGYILFLILLNRWGIWGIEQLNDITKDP